MTVYRVMAVSPDKKYLFRTEKPTMTEAFLVWRECQSHGWHMIGGPEAVTVPDYAKETAHV